VSWDNALVLLRHYHQNSSCGVDGSREFLTTTVFASQVVCCLALDQPRETASTSYLSTSKSRSSMISFLIRKVACLLFTVALLGPRGVPVPVHALATGPQPDSQREFLRHHVAAFAAICGSSLLLPPSSALAYERRDVGDDS
jgi:hypothetical protein